jgi:hypothetical protein
VVKSSLWYRGESAVNLRCIRGQKFAAAPRLIRRESTVHPRSKIRGGTAADPP